MEVTVPELAREKKGINIENYWFKILIFNTFKSSIVAFR